MLMKNLFTLLCAVVLSTAASAQPWVYTYANSPKAPTGIDTMYGTVLNSIPPVPDGQWYNWDLSAAVLASYRYYAAFNAVSDFTGANYANRAYVDVAPNVRYETQLMISIDTTGIKTLGERMDRQAFSLNTGNPSDSIVVLKQDINYSAPLVRMPYPCTMGTKWNSTATSITNLTISYTPPAPLPPMNNVPGQRKSITTSTNEVIGWGNLKIKRLDGKPSGYRQVLLVKNTISVQDSFFVNGAPAPAALLAQAGIQQGETRVVYQKSFYREYEMLPMCNITYENANFNDNEKKDVNMHAQRLPFPDAINDVQTVVAQIYPNPSNGTFTVTVPEANEGEWTYTIADVTGKQVHAGAFNISSGQKQAVVSLNDKVVAGTYVVTIQHNGTAVSGSKVIVQ